MQLILLLMRIYFLLRIIFYFLLFKQSKSFSRLKLRLKIYQFVKKQTFLKIN